MQAQASVRSVIDKGIAQVRLAMIVGAAGQQGRRTATEPMAVWHERLESLKERLLTE